jgi:hypothetical protein
MANSSAPQIGFRKIDDLVSATAAKATYYIESAVKKPKSVSHKTVPKIKSIGCATEHRKRFLDWRMPAALGESHDSHAWQPKTGFVGHFL